MRTTSAVNLVLLSCTAVHATPVNLHLDMTPEERTFYFGDIADSDLEGAYEIGRMRKVEGGLLRYLMGTEQENEYAFEAFGTEVMLNLKKNDRIVSRRANIVFKGEEGEETRKYVNQDLVKCLTLHKDEKAVAAISDCGDGKMHGFISTPKDTFEVVPMTDRLKSMFLLARSNFGIPGLMGDGNDIIVNEHYIVKRATFLNFTKNDAADLKQWNNLDDSILDIEFVETDTHGPTSPKTIETAIFLDHVAYRRFSKVYNDNEIEELLLAYVNQVHALYHLPSLGQHVDLTIITLEIHRTEQFENHNGDRIQLLDSFCSYSNLNNPDDDQGNPRHWDVGILVSGLDIWGAKNGKNYYETLGLARTGGMCHTEHSCVVVEFGIKSAFGIAYPTTGFSAAYTLAHELGHSLGMLHDGNTECQNYGYIMSDYRGPSGQTSWSECSGKALMDSESLFCLLDRPAVGTPEWDHNNTHGVPGYFISAEEQCMFYLHAADKAEVANDPEEDGFCGLLTCSYNGKEEMTGPPLEGTRCGHDGSSWCKGGECVPIYGARWSLTRSSPCQSGCISKSAGFKEVDRVCMILPGFEHQDCEGDESWVELCEDAHLCGGTRSSSFKRKSRTDVATHACERHAKYLPQLDQENVLGKPAKHSEENPEQACSMYCTTTDGEWVTPPGAHFPDGTWCHDDGQTDYFCRNHLCLPGNFTDAMRLPTKLNS